nr:MAG TPA: hypothetical protein [Caudoviricetes sp.]
MIFSFSVCLYENYAKLPMSGSRCQKAKKRQKLQKTHKKRLES